MPLPSEGIGYRTTIAPPQHVHTHRQAMACSHKTMSPEHVSYPSAAPAPQHLQRYQQGQIHMPMPPEHGGHANVAAPSQHVQQHVQGQHQGHGPPLHSGQEGRSHWASAPQPAAEAVTRHAPQPLQARMELKGKDVVDLFGLFPDKMGDVRVIAHSHLAYGGQLHDLLNARCQAGFLSSSWVGNVTTMGKTFKCLESAFAAMQFLDCPRLVDNLLYVDATGALALTASHSKEHGQSNSTYDDPARMWQSMKKVTESKFSDPDLLEQLLATGETFILDHSSTPRTDDWSDNVDGTGKNLGGLLLMWIREQIRKRKGGSPTVWSEFLKKVMEDPDAEPKLPPEWGRAVKAAWAVLQKEFPDQVTIPVASVSTAASDTQPVTAVAEEERSSMAAARSNPGPPTDAREDVSEVPACKKAWMVDPRTSQPLTVPVIAFYYPGHDELCDTLFGYGMFGNFHYVAGLVHIKGKTFTNTEAAFQALTFWQYVDQFAQVDGRGALNLKRSLENGGVQPDLGYHGRGGNWQGMLEVLLCKFHDPECHRALLGTGDAFLLEHNSIPGRDTIWFNNHVGDGKNWLGMQLMLLRDDLRRRSVGSCDDWTSFIRDRCKISAQTGMALDAKGERDWQQTVQAATDVVHSALGSGPLHMPARQQVVP
mmetsp:Transcript_63151/g.117480  ORF Transcript_63151/g.117480 Transcript_63151/m.117480 type:complete len:651 (-) Transcript_63151:136-2088(-)